MPRKPTIYNRIARDGILEMLRTREAEAPLPTLRELGETFSVHPSTISRLLRDLETEGCVWQGPSGRFFPESSRRSTLKGAPVCFIGREMWQWSPLYLEIFEGVSEVCSANGSALIFQSVSSLVNLPDPTLPPVFADSRQQKMEFRKIAPNIPKGCAGFLLDHLWTEETLRSASFPGGQRIQLLYGAGERRKVFAPDYLAGAEIIRDYLKEQHFAGIHLVNPLAGDPLITDSLAQLKAVLAPLGIREIRYHDTEALEKLISGASEDTCLVCPEDNTALKLVSLIRQLVPGKHRFRIEVVATQGTGVVKAPHSRLRYDYRRLGRSAASNILHGTEFKPMRPTLVTRAED